MKAIVLFSGGIDSTVCLALAVKECGKNNVKAVSVNYGQKNIHELNQAKKIIDYYNVDHEIVDLTNIFSNNKNCSMIKGNKEIPKESYEKQVENKKDDKPVSTNVPFRNGLMLSACASIAIDGEYEKIYYGIHLEEGIAATLYPDCSNEFNNAMNEVIKIATENKVSIYAPLVKMTKEEIIKLGLDLKVPYDLTWTCYEEDTVACGKCTACKDRLKGFELNNIKDPIRYRGE